MMSSVDIEKLIAEKKLQIEKEKTFLNLASSKSSCEIKNAKQDSINKSNPAKQVNFAQTKDANHDVADAEEKGADHQQTVQDLEESIPPDLERYIRADTALVNVKEATPSVRKPYGGRPWRRTGKKLIKRYLGLPVMLKAGEYSPNNPLVRGERPEGDVLFGLGEYERRRHTLRRIRQQQYREYLDQQAKKKQEAKEQAERERREREQREREEEERERAREEREHEQRERERRLLEQERRNYEQRRTSVNYANNYSYSNSNRVDTGTQVDSVTTPLSVAVQTDDIDFYQLSSSKGQLTQAERELSPHTVANNDDRPIQPAAWAAWDRRRSLGDPLERSPPLKRPSQKLQSVYMPSIFDADAIQLRNMQAEKEAAARRLFYQQELKNQIMEQQRIREERKAREKMLEQAEMRRLEEQLRMLRAAQDQERGRHTAIDNAMKKDAEEYDMKRTELQKEIEYEEQKLIRAPLLHQALPKRTETSRSEGSKLPFYYPSVTDRNTTYDFSMNHGKKLYNSNLQQESMFSPNYDVDSYLRKNLNFNKDFDIENIGVEKEKNIERVLVHDRPRTKPEKLKEKLPSNTEDTLPIPVLRHSPLIQNDKVDCDLSDAMKKVEDKWKVPAVQKNILKSVPNDEGKKINILTQLGSIRRQLQLEQLKLDQMSKSEE